MFMTVRIAPKLYEIHLGTSWDFILRGNINPSSLKINVLEGLLKLCEKIERKEFPDNALLKGNTYFLKSGTLSRLGFVERKLNLWEYFMTLLSFLEATVLLSLSRKKFAFANINKNKIVYVKSGKLLQSKPTIAFLYKKMTHTLDNKVIPFIDSNQTKVNAS